MDEYEGNNFIGMLTLKAMPNVLFNEKKTLLLCYYLSKEQG